MRKTKKPLTLGQKIKKSRMYVGISQKELGDKLQMSDKTISAYEVDRAEPSLEILQGIALVTKTPVHYFFTKKNQAEAEIKVILQRVENELIEVKKLVKDLKSSESTKSSEPAQPSD